VTGRFCTKICRERERYRQY